MGGVILRDATDLPREDYHALRNALLEWRDAGEPNPVIPHDVDLDGDGVVDGFGLDENDDLVYVKGVALGDTVSESTGGGIETNREVLDG